jgi:hypothetical protein
MSRPFKLEQFAMKSILFRSTVLKNFALSMLLIAMSASTDAGTISLMPAYLQSFDAAFNPIGALPNDGAATPAGGYLQFEFRLTLDDAAPDEDFWTAIFDVQLGPGLVNASGWLDPETAQANGYYPALPSLATYDSNGGTAGGIQSHWQFGNADFGLIPDDLKSIIIESSPSEAANRQYGEFLRPGEGSPDGLGYPTLVGTILVQRTDVIPSSISVVPINGSPWGVYVNNGQGAGDPTAQPGSSFQSSTIVLFVPEPGTLYLAPWLFAAAIFLRRRRGRVNAR